MSPIVRQYVEAVLSVDVDATDEGLVQRFMQEAGASRKMAQRWVSYRPIYTGGRIWHLGREWR